jgi:TusA-related sulfurtransferase
MADQTLNCEGLNCPMPIIKLSKAIKTMDSGQTIEVTATDPAFEADLRAWSKRTKNPLVHYDGAGPLRATIQKK